MDKKFEYYKTILEHVHHYSDSWEAYLTIKHPDTKVFNVWKIINFLENIRFEITYWNEAGLFKQIRNGWDFKGSDNEIKKELKSICTKTIKNLRNSQYKNKHDINNITDWFEQHPIHLEYQDKIRTQHLRNIIHYPQPNIEKAAKEMEWIQIWRTEIGNEELQERLCNGWTPCDPLTGKNYQEYIKTLNYL
jgi:hypothetical protein